MNLSYREGMNYWRLCNGYLFYVWHDYFEQNIVEKLVVCIIMFFLITLVIFILDALPFHILNRYYVIR